MLKIGEFAALAGISVRMLRHYDEFALLKPGYVDPESGYRYYTLEQLPRLNRILALKDLGLALEEVRLLLDQALSADEIRGILKLKQARLQQHIQEEQARLQRVENRLRDIEQEGKLPEADIVLKAQPALHGLSVYGYKWAGYLFQEASAVLKQHNLLRHVRGALTLYHASLEVQQTGIRPVAAMLIENVYVMDEVPPEPIPLPNNRWLRRREIPAYPQVASLVSSLPDHERARDAKALWRWLGQHPYRLIAPSREVYLKRPWHTEEYLTEIVFPVEPVPIRKEID